MPLGHICAHCKSNHTQAGLDSLLCLVCGGRTGADGESLPREPVFHGENPGDRRPK